MELPKVLNKYKNCYRTARQKSTEAAIEHLTSDGSHKCFKELLKSMRSELRSKKICDQCKTITSSVIARKCVYCGGSLVLINEELIFEIFLREVESSGRNIDCRYYPGTGFRAKDHPDAGQTVVPGDPDMLPPTTRENIAILMNTAGYRWDI